jgi:probable phosphoglycerate mutase
VIVAYIDGGARGNPGPAGFGVRIENEDGTLVEEFGEPIGVATNNVAEYRALIAALEWIKRRGHTRAHIRSDSELLVQQMLGKYKVRNPGLQPLHAKARLLAAEIGRVTFEHVERARNAHADRLANAAMDRAAGRSRANSGPAKNPLTPLERSVRILIYRQFLQTGRVPDVEAIARDTGASERDVVSALRRLADLHAIVLAPATTNIWMAHPFSAVPTAYPVVANGISYWANCAWDAAGIVALAGGTGEARTRCADCGAELVMTVRDGRVDGDAVVHYAVPPRKFWENIAYT